MSALAVLPILALLAAPAAAQVASGRSPEDMPRRVEVSDLVTTPGMYSGNQVVVVGDLRLYMGPDNRRQEYELRGRETLRAVRIRTSSIWGGDLQFLLGHRVEVSGIFWDLADLCYISPRGVDCYDRRIFDFGPVPRNFNTEENRYLLGALLVDSLDMDVLPEEEEPRETEEPDIDIPPAPVVDLRDLLRDPEPYLDKRVSVVGKFRGNNLYRDLSFRIKKTPRDFVIKVADAAIWVTGRLPRGKGFELDPGMRRDTGKWLKVTGILWMDADVVYLRAEKLELVPDPEDPALEPDDPEEEEEKEEPKPLPEVTFSVPLDGEDGIPLETDFRIQFSRDMDPNCFEGNVALMYSDGALLVPDLVIEYDVLSRSLLVRPSGGLEPGKPVELILYEGLVDEDGVPMLPQPSSRRASIDMRSGRRKLLSLTFTTAER